jgi:hypothetical protein
MDEDGPNGSPYETLAKHDQSEMKHDTRVFQIPLKASSFERVVNIVQFVEELPVKGNQWHRPRH